mmetsp:Transcript_17751/g.40975  ORF Transcript_17751/g.40975 Transcript_17751/m.40975 type:complete len:275 (+) Transcript_17751:115-939(+)
MLRSGSGMFDIQKVYLVVFVLLFCGNDSVHGLQNLIPKNLFPPNAGGRNVAGSESNKILEENLIDAINELGEGNRLSTDNRIEKLVAELEASSSIPQPAISPSVYGRWRLMHTNNANTASPIQRKAVSSSAFPIYQDIVVNDSGNLIVSQVVKFNEKNELKVDALASTAAYPLEELTERKGDGKLLGLNILGVSVVGEEALEDESRPDSRIDFVFDEGRFEFGSDFSIPYPVPFRLPILRDAVKGWIDITYLSDNMRISRGNKGTTFILVKESE